MHALADFFERFFGGGALVFGADAGGKIAVQIISTQQRGVAVDVIAVKGIELGEADWILMDDARKIHELGKADDFWMIAEGKKLFDRQIGASRLQMRGWHAGGKLDADIHDRFER
ncbi:hypothetical protein D3C87_1745490 [compost metagenome]